MFLRNSSWFPLVLLTLLASLTFWLDSSVQSAPAFLNGSLRHEPDYLVEKFVAVSMSREGAPHYTLSANKMLHYPDDDSTHLEQPVFVSNDPLHSDQPQFRVNADQAKLSSDGENVYLSGNVVVKKEAMAGSGALTVSTQFLHLIPGLDKVITDKPLMITHESAVVNAVGMEMDNRSGVTRLLSQVRGVYQRR